jgi:uroporphyrinogen decarboxylase
MNNRERFLATMEFKQTDRPCHMEYGFWNETYDRWRGEGLPEGVVLPELFFRSPLNDLFGYFDVAKIAYVMVEQYYIPAFPEETLSLTTDERLFRSTRGVLMRERKSNVSIPQFLDYPIKCREDYEVHRERLTGSPEKRYRDDWAEQIAFIRSQDRDLVSTHMDGFFGFPRELVGVERLLTLYHDDPGLMHQIIDDHLELLLTLYEPVIRDLRPDFAFIWEDMCYKNGPLISPRTFREFMLPAYQTLTRFLRQLGVRHIIVDSDGNVEKLIPLWMEGGVTGLLPFEVKSGGDVCRIRKQYPTLQIIGGIEKHALEHGKAEIDAELERVLPVMLAQGGYVAALDHWVHSDIPLANFAYYVEQVKKR